MNIVKEQADAYHAHIYFNQETRDRAWSLREKINEKFAQAKVGRFFEKEIGPHPRWSCQIAFEGALFPAFVPWLMLNRDGLTIFLHAETGDHLADHTEYAIWMGEMLPLKLEIFQS